MLLFDTGQTLHTHETILDSLASLCELYACQLHVAFTSNRPEALRGSPSRLLTREALVPTNECSPDRPPIKRLYAMTSISAQPAFLNLLTKLQNSCSVAERCSQQLTTVAIKHLTPQIYRGINTFVGRDSYPPDLQPETPAFSRSCWPEGDRDTTCTPRGSSSTLLCMRLCVKTNCSKSPCLAQL